MLLNNSRILDWLSYIFVFIFCYTVFVSTFAKEGAVRMPFWCKQLNKYTLQQGWAFFTRNPREPSFNLYAVDTIGKKISNKVIKPNAHHSNLWGISRKSRRLGIEMSFIFTNIKKEHWKSHCCINTIRLNSEDKILISNPMIKYLKGTYILVKENLVPWVYFSSKQNLKYDLEYVFIQIK
jgi:antimicrobial peptide system SdpA family protein